MTAQITNIKFDRPSIPSTIYHLASHNSANISRSAKKNAFPRSSLLNKKANIQIGKPSSTQESVRAAGHAFELISI